MKAIFRSSIFFILFSLPVFLQAQDIIAIATEYNDAFHEWNFYDADDEVSGYLELTLRGEEDWSDWTYRIGDDSGDIAKKWNNDPNVWELRGYDGTITMRTQWRGDLSQWRIDSPDGKFTFKSRYRNDGNEWYLEKEDRGIFAVYTVFLNDPREWEIRDELDEEISQDLKVALIFLALYHTFPK